jgi:hypothetical protein
MRVHHSLCHRGQYGIAGAAAAAALALVGVSAHADQLQNLTVQGTAAQLAAAGYGGLNGNLVSIGQNEPSDPNVFGGVGSNVAPGSALSDGNPNLPAVSVLLAGPAITRGNHPTEVAGVMVSTLPGEVGISPASQVTSRNAADVAQNANNTWNSNNLLTLVQSMYIVNMSWGLNVRNTPAVFPGANNGNNYISPFVDWSATRYNTLVVVAGNEGANAASGTASGSPSDAYNILNIGATGARTNVNANINYTVLAPYTQSNTTADVSPITGYGRLKTDMVAPGGDPFNEFTLVAGGKFPAQFQGTLATPPASGFIDRFHSTAGGFASAGDNDTYFGNGTVGPAGPVPPNTDTSTFSAYLTPTNGTTNAAGNIVPDTIAGTSFSAPEVSGGAALVIQYGKNQNFSTDHRLTKALLMNGAVHRLNVSGAIVNLTNTDGATPWTRKAGVGVTPTCPGFPAGFNPSVRPGLDEALGTGQMNVVNTLNNYAAGQQAPTNVSGNLVNPIGWDTRDVAQGTAANTIVYKYDFNIANVVNNSIGALGSFQATLCWDDIVRIINPGAGNTYANISTVSRNTASPGNLTNVGTGASTAATVGTNDAPLLTDLDLYLFQRNADGSLGPNIDFSTSDIDNAEYIYAQALASGSYELDITNAQYAAPSLTTFGLAWSITYVPEPSSLGVLALGAIALTTRRRNDRRPA